MSTSNETAGAITHITEQPWVPEQREDGVYLVGAKDRTVILKLCRPDYGSDLLMAGYVAGIQHAALARQQEGSDD